MNLIETPLAGLLLVRTSPVADERGHFVRVFCDQELAAVRANWQFPQINLSTTRSRGTLRGMHFQLSPHAETKLIRCVRGRVFDVAVDLRAQSPTFLQWYGVELADDRPDQILIPEGFAHGFQALSDDAQLLYLHTQPWHRESERGIPHDDPRLAISWPLPVSQISDRDRSFPLLEPDFSGLTP